MDGTRSPLVGIRTRVSKTPPALEPYDAFEGLVKDKLVAWPKLTADRAAGFIMSVWASQAVRSGRIKIPQHDLNWIVSTGNQCRRRLKGAESVWVRELASHLMRTSANR